MRTLITLSGAALLFAAVGCAPARSETRSLPPELPRGALVMKEERVLHPGAPGLCWMQMHLRGDLEGAPVRLVRDDESD